MDYRDRRTGSVKPTDTNSEQVMNPNQVRTEAGDTRREPEESRAGTL